jgi:predicted CoA-substrate-specific enzyme activase
MGTYFAGCDVGSTTGKAVVVDGRGDIVATSLVVSRIDPEITAREALDAACAKVQGLRRDNGLSYLVGTGYGRAEVPCADENVSEITCHGVGAHHVDDRIRTIVDIGGQDVKAIGLHPEGAVREFAMNDKCAAGTGRFYEAMSRIFQVDLEELSNLSLKARRTIPVTAQCSVFAETEVVSLIAKRLPPADIAAGIQSAVAKRVFSLVRRVGLEPELAITGGCAKNQGLARVLEKLLRVEIRSLPVDPQLVGALGAAVLAQRRVSTSLGGEPPRAESRDTP